MKNTYHGEYRTVEPCGKIWTTEGQDSLKFPPQVSYTCDTCKVTHNFRLQRTYTTSTPGQEKQFNAYCLRQGIEQGIKIK